MTRYFALAVTTICTTISAAAQASILTLNFSGTISSQFDYVTGKYEPLSVPSKLFVTVKSPLNDYRIVDYGTTTIVYYPFGEAVINEPLQAFVGEDNVGNRLDDLGKSAHFFTDTNDYDIDFIEEIAAQDNIYHYRPDRAWDYHVEIRLMDRSTSKGGLGNEDYALSDVKLVDFLDRVVGLPIGYYNSYWSEYIFNEDGSITYTAGKSWSSYSMTLDSFTISSPIPEPSTWILMVFGLGMTAGILRHRSNKSNC